MSQPTPCLEVESLIESNIESVAEVAKRPLYHISAGELSTDVSSLEEELRTIFRMGARWNAIVLLDEADVLMSKRTSDNLTRNSVVAGMSRYVCAHRDTKLIEVPQSSSACSNIIVVCCSLPRIDEMTLTMPSS